jgi:ADP-heptose:LPS heptosyltransferase
VVAALVQPPDMPVAEAPSPIIAANLNMPRSLVQAPYLATQANTFASRITAQPLAVLIPGTTWAAKIWPAQNWINLAQLLGRSLGFRLLLVGGASELKANQLIEQSLRDGGIDNIVNLTGQTSIVQLVALFQGVDLVVGADCGPLHIAAATGRPKVLGIFGSTPVKRNGPYGRQCRAVALNLDCQPCFMKNCPLSTTACLKDMTADFVMARLKELLSS